MTAPIATFCPSEVVMVSRPPAGAITSVVALSVSSSHTGSLAFTTLPLALSQRPMVPSVIDSPTEGTTMSTAMKDSLTPGSYFRRHGSVPFHWKCTLRAGSANQMRHGTRNGRPDHFLLLTTVDLQGAGRRAGAGIAANILDVVAQGTQARLHEEPAAHVL